MKKRFKIIILLVLLLLIVYHVIWSIQTKIIKNNILKSNWGIIQILENYQIIRCDWNILEPEFRIALWTRDGDIEVDFFRFNKTFLNDNEIKKIDSYYWIHIKDNVSFEKLINDTKKKYCNFKEEIEEEKINEKLLKELKTYKVTEENLKKLEQVWREEGAYSESEIESLLENIKNSGEITTTADLDKVELRE